MHIHYFLYEDIDYSFYNGDKKKMNSDKFLEEIMKMYEYSDEEIDNAIFTIYVQAD